jgi:hypothetical protein
MSCSTCQREHATPGGRCPFDWPGIAMAEQVARERGNALPKCDACAAPMWCGQRIAHHSCGGS